MSRLFGTAVTVGCLSVLALSGCTTTAAKKALAKPPARDSYTSFDSQTVGENSKRKAPTPVLPKDNADPEVAVTKLVEYLQAERAYAVSAEEQLRVWGNKQGVDKIIVSKVRILLKHPRIEVRAPALRLVMMFGDNASNGDLIECLADQEYGMRSTAFKALKARTKQDFSYDPGAGEVARGISTERWRRWWQSDQSRLAMQAPSIYEKDQPSEPKVQRAGETAAQEPIPEADTFHEPKPAAKKKGTDKAEKADKKKPKPVDEDAEDDETASGDESKLLLRGGKSKSGLYE
jgi:hypothetical protein